MLFIIYSATDESSIKDDLGLPEYSYYFVLKEFRPLLERLGRVEVVRYPEKEVDALYDECLANGEKCVFLSFSPPNKTLIHLRCPTIPVFAWEFDSLPNEVWDEDTRNDWTMVLRNLGRAIVHSRHTETVVRRQLGKDFPVVTLPAPVWDRFDAFRKKYPPAAMAAPLELRIRGTVMDSRVIAQKTARNAESEAESEVRPEPDLSVPDISEGMPEIQEMHRQPPLYFRKNFRFRLGATKRHASEWYREVIADLLPQAFEKRMSAFLRWVIRQLQGMNNRSPDLPGMVAPEPEPAPVAVEQPAPLVTHEVHREPTVRLELSGVLYTAVFNPYDGRKNWLDMLTAFCEAFAGEEHATLVLKFTHHNSNWAFTILDDMLRKLPRFKCRVVGIHGFLEQDSYNELIAASAYTVNASYGEGQCLPLMEFMACGKPAISPRHSAMEDYIDKTVAFVVKSSEELCCWPQDPRLFFRSHRHRIDWASLRDAYRESFRVATENPGQYLKMANASIARLRDHASHWTVTDNLKNFLGLVQDANALESPSRNWSELPRKPVEEDLVLPEDVSARCGLTDAVLSGWFNKSTGELKPGFPIGPEDVFVDVGCGAGGACHFAAQQGARVVYCDVDATKVDHVRKWLERDGIHERAEGHVSNTNPLPLASGVASRVVAMEMLEHVDDPDLVMQELVRVGKPGALYLLSVPAEQGENLQKDIAPKSYFTYPNHIRIFSRSDFVGLVERAGLVVEREQVYGFYWTLWMCLFWACQSEEGAKEGDATLDMISGSDHPLLESWSETWSRLLQLPAGLSVKQALDSWLPKNQIIIARKP